MSKVLNKAVLVLAGAIGMSGLAMSQDATAQAEPAPPAKMQHQHGMNGGDADSRMDRMSRELNLTDDQKTKLKPIFQSEWQEMKPVREDSSLSQDQKHEKMKSIHEKYRAQVEGVLTPDQQEKWKNMQSNRMQHGGMKKSGEAPQN
jgi:periplasmic protein CpxP/Spy